MHFKTLLSTAVLATLAIGALAAPEAAPFAEGGEEDYDYDYDDASDPTPTEAPSLAARAADPIKVKAMSSMLVHGIEQYPQPDHYTWGPHPFPSNIPKFKPHGVIRGHGKHAKKKDFKKVGKGHKKHHKGHKKHTKGHKKHHKGHKKHKKD